MTDAGVPALGPISVIIPTRDRHEMLANCISRILPQLGPDDELVIVDSASKVAIPFDLAGDAGRVIRSDIPGSSLARNIGWKSAKHQIVAFVDDDVWVKPHWADAVRAAFVDPDVSMITARVSIPEGQDPERPVAIKDELVAHNIDSSMPSSFESTACCAFRRNVLEATGGFDERLGPGTWFSSAEDLEVFDRVRRAGFRGRFDPTVHAQHDQWRSRRQLLVLEWRYGKGMGAHLWMVGTRDRKSARSQAKVALWEDGLARVGPAILQHYEFAIVSQIVRFTGSVLGFIAGAFVLRHKVWPAHR